MALTRVFLMFVYESTGLWYARDEHPPRPAGTVDPGDLALSAGDESRAGRVGCANRHVEHAVPDSGG
jgi:hypothetical protein